MSELTNEEVCNYLRTIAGDDNDTSQYAANLIKQQQAKIAEYERLHGELAKALNHDAESPSLCDLVAVARRVIKERNELAATVERLREIAYLADGARIENSEGNSGLEKEWLNKLYDTVGEYDFMQTPQQNLNAVKREAFIEGYQSTSEAYHGENTEYMNIVKQANTKYPSDKE